MNQYLEQDYCDDHNQRFAIDASSEVDYHLPTPGARQRREILRLETERVLGNDWVVRHHNRLYQVERQSRPHAPAQSAALVCQWEDGTVEIQYRGQKLQWHEIEEQAGKPEATASKRRKPFTPPAAASQGSAPAEAPETNWEPERKGDTSNDRRMGTFLKPLTTAQLMLDLRALPQ